MPRKRRKQGPKDKTPHLSTPTAVEAESPQLTEPIESPNSLQSGDEKVIGLIKTSCQTQDSKQLNQLLKELEDSKDVASLSKVRKDHSMVTLFYKMLMPSPDLELAETLLRLELVDTHFAMLFQFNASQEEGEIRLVRANLIHCLFMNPSRSLLNSDKIYNFIALLLRYHANVNAKDSKHNTPLYYAAMDGDLKIVNLLLDNKAEINLPCEQGNTALSMGISAKIEPSLQIELLQRLLEAKANPNHIPDQKDSALMSAVMENNGNRITQLLLSHKADINYRIQEEGPLIGLTPLIAAVYLSESKEKTKIVATLIENKVEVHSFVDDYLNKLFNFLMLLGERLTPSDIQNMFYKKFTNPLTEKDYKNFAMSDETELRVRAAKKNKQIGEFKKVSMQDFALETAYVDAFKLIIEAKADLNEVDSKGTPLLFNIICNGNKSVIYFLHLLLQQFSSKIDFNARDLDNYTSLMRLAENKILEKNEKIKRTYWLLKMHADPDLLNQHQENALQIAIRHSNHDIAYLLAAETKLSIDQLSTAVKSLEQHDNQEVLTLLLKNHSPEFIKKLAILAKAIARFIGDKKNNFSLGILENTFEEIVVELLEEKEDDWQTYRQLKGIITRGTEPLEIKNVRVHQVKDSVFIEQSQKVMETELTLNKILSRITMIADEAERLRVALKKWQEKSFQRSAHNVNQAEQIKQSLLSFVNYNESDITEEVMKAVDVLATPGLMSSLYSNEEEIIRLKPQYNHAWQCYHAQCQTQILFKLNHVSPLASFDEKDIVTWKEDCIEGIAKDLSLEKLIVLSNELTDYTKSLDELTDAIDNLDRQHERERKIPKWQPKQVEDVSTMTDVKEKNKVVKEKPFRKKTPAPSFSVVESKTKSISFSYRNTATDMGLPGIGLFSTGRQDGLYYERKRMPEPTLTEFMPSHFVHQDAYEMIAILEKLLYSPEYELTPFKSKIDLVFAKRNALCLLCCWLAEDINHRRFSLRVPADLLESFSIIRNSIYHRFCNNFTVTWQNNGRVNAELEQLATIAETMMVLYQAILNTAPVDVDQISTHPLFQRLKSALEKPEFHHHDEKYYFNMSRIHAEIYYKEPLYIASVTFVMALTAVNKSSDRLVSNVIRHAPNYNYYDHQQFAFFEMPAIEMTKDHGITYSSSSSSSSSIASLSKNTWN